MIWFGCRPNVGISETLINGLYNTKNMMAALRLHKQMVNAIDDDAMFLYNLDIICYSAMLDWLCNEGLIDEADELFLEIETNEFGLMCLFISH